MNKRIVQIKLVILTILTLFMYNQCGNPYSPKPTELKFSGSEESANVFSSNESLTTFEDTVYRVTRSRCIGCHKTQNPTHAHDDVKVAHDIVVNQFKVNFSNVGASRLVAKIRDDAHNCWSGDCNADGDEMEEAVQKWADVVNALEVEEDPVDVGGTTGSTGNGGDTIIPGLDSKTAFNQTVYPITRMRCASCHNTRFPKHASPDSAIAHDDVVFSNSVDFSNIQNSRLVQRLETDNHHCWGSCQQNANEMKSAITQWQELMEDTIIPNTGGGSVPSTEPMTTAQSAPVASVIGADNSVLVKVNMSTGSIQSPFVFANGYLQAPSGNTFNQDANSTSAGLATYSFSVPSSGTYKIRGMVKGVDASKNSFFISVDNENFFDWHIMPGSQFNLQNISRTGSYQNKNWNLTAGNHQLRIKQREPESQIQYVEIYEDSGNSTLQPGEGILEYDISEILGVNEVVKFRIKIKEYDEFSYKLWDPEIISQNSNIRVKNIKTLINGYYNPQHSAYTIVDTTTTPNMTNVSPYYLLALKDQGLTVDRFSFKFEILQIDN